MDLRLRFWALVPLLLLSLSPRVASAASVAVVGVHGNGDQTHEDLASLDEALVAGFKTAGMDVVHGADLRARLVGTREHLIDKVYLEPVRQAFDEGRILYEKAQPDVAIEALSRAEVALDGVEEFIRDPRLSVDVQLYLGLCHISLGDSEAARVAFAEVVRMDPNRILDTFEYPPRIVDLFEEVRADILALEGASITVSSGSLAGARTFVDGRMVGTTPVTVTGLPPGFHTLLVDGGASGRFFQTWTLQSAEAVEVDATLTIGTLGLSGDDPFQPERSHLTRRLYRELSFAAGTDIVAVAAFDEAGDFRMALYSGRSGTFSASQTASLAAAPGARSAFVRQLVERVALYADDDGTITEERISADALPLRLGANTVLNGYVFGLEDRSVADASAVRELEPEPRVRRKPNKAAGVVVAIISGVLGATAAGIGIGAAVDANQPSTGGVLVITIP